MTALQKLFRDLRWAIFYRLFQTRKIQLLTLGNRATGCHWSFYSEPINSESVVYSGGVGNDITFEHELVQRFGCSVVLFDPSPTGRATMALPENLHTRFRFFPVGLGGETGTLNLAPPLNAEEGSWYGQTPSSGCIHVPCEDLCTLMERSGHTRINLLKLDIEGSEYDVIDDLLRRRISVDQICVEYHHGIIPGIRRFRTIKSIFKLLLGGYRLLYQEGNNHTFVLKSCVTSSRKVSTEV